MTRRRCSSCRGLGRGLFVEKADTSVFAMEVPTATVIVDKWDDKHSVVGCWYCFKWSGGLAVIKVDAMLFAAAVLPP